MYRGLQGPFFYRTGPGKYNFTKTRVARYIKSTKIWVYFESSKLCPETKEESR